MRDTMDEIRTNILLGVYMPRKRGAPLGNTNALKHGFYSRKFKKREAADLQAALGEGLTDEIKLTRVLIRRVFEFLSDSSDLPLEDAISGLTAISSANAKLASMLRTQQMLNSHVDTSLAFSQALKEISDELGINQP
jgi:hypothetical protein